MTDFHDHATPAPAPDSARGRHGAEAEEPLTFLNWPQVVRSLMLGAWSLFFVVITITGGYTAYIRAELFWLPLFGGAFLLLMIWCSRNRHRIVHEHDEICLSGEEECWRRHRFRFGDLRPMAIFTLPLMLGVLVLPASLNAVVLANKGLNLTPVNATSELRARLAEARKTPPGPKVRPTQQSVEDVWKSAARGTGLGSKVMVIGTVSVPREPHRFPERPSGWAYVSDLVITCCYADATTVTLALVLPGVSKTVQEPIPAQSERSKAKPEIQFVMPDREGPADPVLIREGRRARIVGTVDMIEWEEGKLMPALIVEFMEPLR